LAKEEEEEEEEEEGHAMLNARNLAIKPPTKTAPNARTIHHTNIANRIRDKELDCLERRCLSIYLNLHTGHSVIFLVDSPCARLVIMSG